MGPHKSVTERLSEHAARHLSARNFDSNIKTVCGKSLSVPLSSNTSDLNDRRKPLGKPPYSKLKKERQILHQQI